MNSFLTEIRQTIIPDPGSRHGPLPPLLVTMTIVTGLVDAFSYLVLGHVFVANMTGNVVFLGFALAGARGFSIPASVVALAAFGLGALGSGRLGSAIGRRRAEPSSAPPPCKRSSSRLASSWPCWPAARCPRATATA